MSFLLKHSKWVIFTLLRKGKYDPFGVFKNNLTYEL